MYGYPEIFENDEVCEYLLKHTLSNIDFGSELRLKRELKYKFMNGVEKFDYRTKMRRYRDNYPSALRMYYVPTDL